MRRQNDLERERKDFIDYIKKIDKSEIKNTTIFSEASAKF